MPIKHLNRFVANVSGKVPLRTALIVSFVLPIFGTVGLVGYLSFRNGQKAVNNVAAQLRSEITNRIQEHVLIYLETPHLVNKLNANAIELGQVNLQEPRSVERHLWKEIQAFSLSFTYFSTVDGKHFSAGRAADGTLVVSSRNTSTGGKLYQYSTNSQGERTKLKVFPNYDPRIRPWYVAAVEAGKPVWSEIYPDFDTKELAVTAAQPLYDKSGRLRGVLGSDFYFSQVNEFLRSLKIGHSGQTFIIERDGMLVTTSTLNPVFIIKGNDTKRIKATESNNALISQTAKYLLEHFGNLSKVDSSQQLNFDINGAKQFLQVTPLRDNRGLDWLIVVVVPEADFMEQINANTRTTIGLCLVALVMATAIGILTSRWVIQPILRLNTAAKDIAQGEWDKTVEIERSDELGELAKSFNSMAGQLKDSFETLEAKNADLQRLDKLKDEFLANTSHELRTPLNGMIGIAESMLDGATGQLSDTQKQNLLMIATSGHRLANLVNDILDFSQLRHKNIELQLKPVGLREIAQVVLTLNQTLAGKKDLQLINSIPPDLPPAEADENRLQQILHNLVGNAIKFTPAGTVEVSAEVKSQKSKVKSQKSPLPITNDPLSKQLAITVADTGIGISADKLDCIFESFEQADGSTAREYGGTGLGLAVTKKLVELHGGSIKVESTVGQGSWFTFTLPISQEQVERKSQIAAVKESLSQTSLEIQTTDDGQRTTDNQQNIQILIVDDEPVNLQVLVNHLSLANYAIIQASNGEEALAAIENGLKPDLILLDVMMPKMTGYEVTKKLRQRFPASELPILLLTAKTQIQDLVTGLEVGANDYLTKPISKDELLARIKTHINLHRLRDENVRLSTELDITRRLQQMLLPNPSELESIEELEIAGFMAPADKVGGDYYDVLKHDGRVKIGIGDVTGHGLESGVLMIMAQTAIRTLSEYNETDSVKFLDVLNRTIYQNVERMNSDKNMTLALLDYQEGKLRLSGQHEEIIIVRSDGRVERIDTIDLGFPIGLDEHIADFIAQEDVRLNPGDVVALYTDGITEAEDINGVQYGLERLCQVLSRHCSQSASQIKQAAIEDVRQHIGKQIVYDDITLLVIKQK
jgi:signal transduction histidine kinase/serine phosphatase RsbU (regulator of sigma subunit)